MHTLKSNPGKYILRFILLIKFPCSKIWSNFKFRKKITEQNKAILFIRSEFTRNCNPGSDFSRSK